MTYEQIVDMVRKVFEYADARNIYEHIAFQVNVEGEGEGIFYFEVADRQCNCSCCLNCSIYRLSFNPIPLRFIM